MKLWLLRPKEDLPDKNNPWEPGFDCCFGFVVRAKTESDARGMVYGNTGDEREYKGACPWSNPWLSTCVELTAKGPTGIIIRDFRSA